MEQVWKRHGKKLTVIIGAIFILAITLIQLVFPWPTLPLMIAAIIVTDYVLFLVIRWAYRVMDKAFREGSN
ncbi:hypothetical protein [Priestia koreensis]|uniref:Uncharacterized protein n=1 Tax=Priestia koreensis TaxID=284581 RepID=A0A0M0L5E4_9BACI|nr:hypothetical protein [Priestia koreensis]KOO46300.1 hypothetical protein AMD01_10655 [Priestia koreensis]MCM3007080.1 hypothetical protein [Priestia koreensis]UNL83594.1 hypothetical protein IE339_15665 [Priestia koreensis]